MAFTRVKPTGWARGETLSAAETNSLDTNMSNAVDKTGGTTITGAVTWGSGSSATFASGSTLTQNAGSTWSLSGLTTVPTGATLTLASGSTLTCDATCTWTGTSTWSGTQTMSGVLTVSGANGKITTASSGRIELGDNDWPLLVSGHAGRSRAVRTILSPAIGTWVTFADVTWNPATPGLTVATVGVAITVVILPLHNGATLGSLDVYFTPRTGTAAAPATTPSVAMYRRAVATGAGVGAQTALSGTPVQSYTAGGDYWDGKVKIMTYTCTTNNVVDTSTYVYYLIITDESGANSAVGNKYHAVVANLNTITDMRFQ